MCSDKKCRSFLPRNSIELLLQLCNGTGWCAPWYACLQTFSQPRVQSREVYEPFVSCAIQQTDLFEFVFGAQKKVRVSRKSFLALECVQGKACKSNLEEEGVVSVMGGGRPADQASRAR